jgi:serine/threonine protein kinase
MEAGTLPPRDTSGPDTLREPPGKVQHASGFPRMFGRYRLEKQLGQGGMGSVFLARDTQLDRPVALKIPHFTPEDGPKVRERFLHEARAAAALQHANICPLHDVGVIDGTHYLTMAYIDGKSLSGVLRSQSKPLPMLQVAALVRKLALALDEAHRAGVVHRDLKPDNIMITKRGEPVVMDFGLARRDDSSSRLTQQGTIMGTPAYMAPEQARGNLDLIGPASDIYSLGVILYELLAGRVPFQGDTMSILTQLALDEPKHPTEFRPEVAPEMAAICLKAMAKDPAARHRSMADFAAALAGYIRAAKSNAAPSKENEDPPLVERSGGMATMPESATAPRRRGFPWGWALLALVLLGGGGFGAYWYLTNQEAEPTPDKKTDSGTEQGTGKESETGIVKKEEGPGKTELTPVKPERLVWPKRPLDEGKIAAPYHALGKDIYNADFLYTQKLENWPRPGGPKPKFEGRYIRDMYLLRKTPQSDLGPLSVTIPRLAPVDQFAIQVTGRVPLPHANGWGLMVSSTAQVGGKPRYALDVHFDRNDALLVSSHTAAVEKPLGTPLARVSHKKLLPKHEFNRVLLIVRDKYLEIYANGFAVYNPIPIEADLTPARLSLVVWGRMNAEAEFKQVTVWSATGLRPLKQRIAAVK